ncbi:MAG: hypothetical protein GWM88_05225 [Pseudomonadales bacterium]|nr:hypothetical protein [Pseudomonadales bacterium]NIX07442.1 hypothetical protein [Pseudomonadales bacterium]
MFNDELFSKLLVICQVYNDQGWRSRRLIEDRARAGGRLPGRKLCDFWQDRNGYTMAHCEQNTMSVGDASNHWAEEI